MKIPLGEKSGEIIRKKVLNNNLKLNVMDNVKRKCQVILLPSLEKTNLILNESLKILNSGLTNLSVENNPHIKYQHLYILSDDEIKVGDICYYKNSLDGGNFLVIYTKYNTYHELNVNPIKEYGTIEGGITPLKSDIFKVIASTDKSFNLPQPSPQFVNKYCEEYNKGNIITNMLVTYDNHLPDTDGDYGKPQVDKNNCITITKLKEHYTLKEISDAFKLEGIYYTEDFLYNLLNQ